MDEYEKATREVVEEFFENFPELLPIRDLIQDQVDRSYISFFGYNLVLIAKASVKLMEDKNRTVRIASEQLLHKILAFLENCLQTDDEASTQIHRNSSVLDARRVQAVIYFTEGLYKAGEEYRAIVDLAPHKLKIDIARVEEYYGIPKADKQRFYRVLHNALRAILSEKKEDER